MSECIVCGKEHNRRGKYCSDACKQAAYRNKNETVTDQTVTPEQAYEFIPDVKVYGGLAVQYDLDEAWDLRPELLDENDRPKPDNRGKYIRPDGSEYQIDVTGQVFELIDGEVYPGDSYKTPETAVSGQTALRARIESYGDIVCLES